jgi:hypothetical protein
MGRASGIPSVPLHDRTCRCIQHCMGTCTSITQQAPAPSILRNLARPANDRTSSLNLQLTAKTPYRTRKHFMHHQGDAIQQYSGTCLHHSSLQHVRTHAADLQDRIAMCLPPVTVVASSVPRGHVIVVVQDASFHVVPRGCGELPTWVARYTMHLC